MDREGRATRDREIPKIKGHFITKIIEALLFFQVITSISTMNFRFCLVETANQRRKWFWRLIWPRLKKLKEVWLQNFVHFLDKIWLYCAFFEEVVDDGDSLLLPILLGVLIPVVLGAFAAALVYYFKFYKNRASKVGVDEKNQVALKEVDA
jgi:hypothetical protein